MDNKNILIYYIGIVIILAATHRIFLIENRKKELYHMNLPSFTDIFIIVFELICGTLLLINFKYKKNILFIVLIFMIIGSILILINNFNQLLQTYNEIFTYQPNSLSFLLHMTFIIIIISILIK